MYKGMLWNYPVVTYIVDQEGRWTRNYNDVDKYIVKLPVEGTENFHDYVSLRQEGT